jgi:hypothetical protein
MSVLSLAYPAQAAINYVQTFSGSFASLARMFLGLGVFTILASVAMVFKPLILGVVRTVTLVIRPRVSLQQRLLKQRWEGVQLLNCFARDVEATQPNLAAEMRYLAARG